MMYRGWNEESQGITSLIEEFRLQVQERSRFRYRVVSRPRIFRKLRKSRPSLSERLICEFEGARRPHVGFPVIYQQERLFRSKVRSYSSQRTSNNGAR